MSYRKHNWPAIRAEYVEGIDRDGKVYYPTLDELARLHNAHDGHLRARAGKEQWGALRDVYRAKLEQARQEQRTTVLAARGADFDTRVLKVAEALIAQVVAGIRAMNTRRDKDGNQVPPDAGEVQKLTAALRSAHATGRIALGESENGGSPAGAVHRGELLVRLVREGKGYTPQPDDDGDGSA